MRGINNEKKHKKELIQQRQHATRYLDYLMFPNRKLNGEEIKGRGCADGRKQRAWTGKEEATSLTIATEAVMWRRLTSQLLFSSPNSFSLPGSIKASAVL